MLQARPGCLFSLLQQTEQSCLQRAAALCAQRAICVTSLRAGMHKLCQQLRWC